jgi:small-conductance mechanosensitive channel
MAWIVLVVAALFLSFLFRQLLKLVARHLRRLSEHTESIWDDVAVDLIDGLKGYIIFIWIFYFGSHALAESDGVRKFLLAIVVCATSFQMGLWGLHVIKSWRSAVLEVKIKEDASSAAALGLLYKVVQISFLAAVVLLSLSNLGVDITALVAGLGVGGIAIALAAQNVLGDLLASLSIVLDKPFIVGDFVVAGEEKGTVENIGIKTTRLRSISGEEVILSNKDLLESRVKNFKRMWNRRVLHNFGVIYSTPIEVVEKIPKWVEEIVLRYEMLKFDRCHFAAFGASSLDFQLVFFVKDSDYNIFMNYQQSVLVDIFKKFQQEGVEFAFPTQTLHVESDQRLGPLTTLV